MHHRDSHSSAAPNAALIDVEPQHPPCSRSSDRIASMPPVLFYLKAQERLTKSLAKWSLAAENATLAAAERDIPALVEAVQTLEAELDQFTTSAAAELPPRWAGLTRITRIDRICRVAKSAPVGYQAVCPGQSRSSPLRILIVAGPLSEGKQTITSPIGASTGRRVVVSVSVSSIHAARSPTSTSTAVHSQPSPPVSSPPTTAT